MRHFWAVAPDASTAESGGAAEAAASHETRSSSSPTASLLRPLKAEGLALRPEYVWRKEVFLCMFSNVRVSALRALHESLH